MEDLQMKKTIFALVAVALSLSLTACATAKKAESGTKGNASKTGAAGVPYHTLNKKFFKTRGK